MNQVQIEKMLRNIKADFVGMGRPWHDNDNSVMELLIQMYCQTDWMDWEEVNYLFTNYLRKGVLNFPDAAKMARGRLMV